MKYLWRNKILLMLLVLFVCLTPNVIAIPQQSRTENIITAMGIDKTNDGYEIFVQYVIPYAQSAQNSLKVMSGKGATVGEAIENMDMEYGKISGFAHCRAIIFNEQASEENLTEILDYLLRIKTNTTNIVLINTTSSAGEVLKAVDNLDNEFYTIINSNNISNEQRKYQDLKSISDYYNAQFGECKSIAINIINLENATSESSSGGGSSSSGSSSGESSSSGGSSSGESSSGGGSSNEGSSSSEGGGSSGKNSSDQNTSQAEKIQNRGELLVLKNGKKVTKLSKEQAQNTSWFDNEIREGNVKIHNYTDNIYKNADINFYVYDKHAKISTSFEGGEPVYTLNLKVYMRTAQILQKGTKKEIYEVPKKEFSEKLKYEISSNIKQSLLQAEENFKTYDYDIVRCNEFFHKFHPQKYKEYVEKIGVGDSFLSHVKFVYNVEVIQRL